MNCIILTDEALRDFLVTNAAHITEDMLVETLALARSEEAA